MIEPIQLRDLIIIPTLHRFKMYSESAVNLLLGTCAQESGMGRYIKQVGGGPALGIWQMEPVTHDDLWVNYIEYRETLEGALADNGIENNVDRLVYDLRYACIMARLHYRRVKEPLPDAHNQVGLAEYWKRHYNTIHGAGTLDEFMHNYGRYVLDVAL